MTNSKTLFVFTGSTSFVVYLCTLAPSITWRNEGSDSGDLAAAVAVGGVPHPPGYPTYLVLGSIFKLLPFGDIAYRLNLLSATSAALTIAVMGLVIYQTLSTLPSHQAQAEEARRSGSLIWFCAASASLTLAFSNLFWSQAVIAEVYTLNALFAAGLLYGALGVNSANERWLVPGLAGLFGLSLGNHPSILLLSPLIIWILKARWRWRLIATTLLAFFIGLLIYLILPLRAATLPPINWGMVTTWPNFWWLVSAEPYRHFLFALPWQYVPGRIVAQLRLLSETFMWWGLPLGLLGLHRLTQLNRSLAYGSLVAFLLISIYSIGYNTTDSYVYLLPALLIFSLWLGWGIYDFGNALQQLIRDRFGSRSLASWGIIIILPLLSLGLNFSDQNISQDDEAFTFAQRSLQIVEPGAIIITDNDPHTFALWYGRYGLGLRPDVIVININLLPYAWYRQTLHRTHANLILSDQANRPLTTLPAFIELNLSGSPIYLATLQPPTLEGYRLETQSHLQRVWQVGASSNESY